MKDLDDDDDEDEEEEEEAPQPQKKSGETASAPKQKFNEQGKRKTDVVASAVPAKKAKGDDHAKPAAQASGQAEYVAKLIKYIKENGKADVGQLGNKVQRPKELPKLKVIL